MTTTMTKEELRDALIEIAKQAYWEGRNWVDNDGAFENTETYKAIMENGQ